MNLKTIIKETIYEYLTEEDSNKDKRFVVDKEKFQLLINNISVAESYYDIEQPDDLFDKRYISLFKLKTNEKYRGKGYMKYLLQKIFEYVKNKLNIDHILLNVYENNKTALNLYINNGFEVYKYFDDVEDEEPYYILIKNL